MRWVAAVLVTILIASRAFAAGRHVYFGDSLTSCANQKCYASYHSGDRGRSFKSFALAGHQTSDQWEFIRDVRPADGDALYYLIGTNDLVRRHLDPLWLSISNYAFGASVYRLGGHVDQGADPMFSGDLLILGYQIGDALKTNFSVLVDGRWVATLSQKPPTTIKTWYGKPPFNTVAPSFMRMAGFGPGIHRISIQSDCEKCPSPVEWIWRGPAGVPLYVMTTPRMTQEAYSQVGSSDAAIDAFAEFQRSLVATARHDGVNAILVDTNRIIEPGRHLIDGIHFNELGHRTVADLLDGATRTLASKTCPAWTNFFPGWIARTIVASCEH